MTYRMDPQHDAKHLHAPVFIDATLLGPKGDYGSEGGCGRLRAAAGSTDH